MEGWREGIPGQALSALLSAGQKALEHELPGALRVHRFGERAVWRGAVQPLPQVRNGHPAGDFPRRLHCHEGVPKAKEVGSNDGGDRQWIVQVARRVAHALRIKAKGVLQQIAEEACQSSRRRLVEISRA